MAEILLVEDDAAQRSLVAGVLRAEQHQVTAVDSETAAMTALARSLPSLVISDFKLAEGDGLSLLRSLRKLHGDAVAFVMVTAYGSIGHAVEAIRAGADDYLAKPFEREALLLAVDKALRSRDLRDENRRLSEAVSERDRLVDMIGRAPAMQQVYRRIEKVAPTEATVLIGGPSGSGKELVARALHRLSRRSGGPFVAVNCAAIPEGLIEAEFFGAERGAYTGAQQARPGRFEAAAGGTLFLDEIGELPLHLQPKLLRVLQEGVVTRVGGSRDIRVDARVVAATNRDLATEVAAGRFREDLYYRLNVVPITLPPLEQRREDIPLLVRHFAERAARQHGVAETRIPAELLRTLMARAWPGNVRELANTVERLVLLAEDAEMAPDDLPEVAPPTQAPTSFALPEHGLHWESHEKDVLTQALERAQGNRSRAARLLGLPYKAFLYRMEKYGLG
ncbi:MAG TPA: sigma-54 dependent transcriptional regulator [Xanthomonadaceae bacterium]|nr:sigma-54 dependent transcriptional regulator [Xanthomonadaceae bacterium]